MKLRVFRMAGQPMGGGCTMSMWNVRTLRSFSLTVKGRHFMMEI
ncbi:hypothetical protein SAMN05444672_101459 [Bacillus sp. OK838]|nr:hypothetical protein SAMN05444672_101459 [Bacillus sp. OK838]